MSNWSYPFWFAHRGAGLRAPENTLAAFRLGLSHGFEAFECDVKLSADGVPFLLHDDDLDRTTNGHGAAGAWGWSELSQLDAGGWHGPQFAGEPLASLASVAAFCVANGSALNLELKPCPGQAHRTGEQVATWLSRHWPAGLRPPLLSSFDPDALQGALETGLPWPRALLLEASALEDLDRARALGCVAMVVNHQALSETLITQAHAGGLRVLAYTVNTLEAADRLRSWGIDGLITDSTLEFSPNSH